MDYDILPKKELHSSLWVDSMTAAWRLALGRCFEKTLAGDSAGAPVGWQLHKLFSSQPVISCHVLKGAQRTF